MTAYLALSALPLYLLGIFYTPLLFAGALAQFAYLLARGVHLGRIPLAGLHDTLIFFSSSLVIFSAPFYRPMKEKRMLFYRMLGVSALILAAAAQLSAPHEGPLPPVLDTYWFELHVALSFFSYALFGIGAFIGILSLRDESLADLEKKQYKAIFFGYLLFSASMIFGGIWAFLAWGTYWLWTPKELWTSILWLFYSFYLHARSQPGWRGRKAVLTGILGFALVLFTYMGVGLLMKSSHSF
ncbi:MAG: cytochrome c biogenesis protein CcsA [Nitrospiraceae bacterium]|nr:cytochrome c biogenesis protein CcsA [Nitrospiraceae bacterium]